MVIGFLSGRKHSRLRGLLSSYIDEQVSESEARQVDDHLHACDECRLEMEILRTTVSLTRSLPQLETLRPFTLTEAPAPAKAARTMVWTTRLATSAAAVLLVALLLGDTLGIFAQTGVLDGKMAVPSTAAPAASRDSVATAGNPAAAAAPAPALAAAPAPATAIAAPGEEAEEMPVKELDSAPVAAMAAPPPETEAAQAAEVEVEEAEASIAGDMALVAQALEALDEAAALEGEEGPDAAIAASPLAVASPSPGGVIAPQTARALTPEAGLVQRETAALEAISPGVGGGEVQRQPAETTAGIALPLWQLEAAVSILLLVLGLVMLRVARRDRSRSP